MVLIYGSAATRSHQSNRAQVMIRRPAHTKPRPRARIDDDVKKVETAAEEQPDATGLPKSTSQITLSDDVEPEDELMRIRALLHPPPIPGVDDWGIPPEASEPCDPALEVRASVVRRRDSHSVTLYCRCKGETVRILGHETRSRRPQALQRFLNVKSFISEPPSLYQTCRVCRRRRTCHELSSRRLGPE